jgi:general secretion pathway protein D
MRNVKTPALLSFLLLGSCQLPPSPPAMTMPQTPVPAPTSLAPPAGRLSGAVSGGTAPAYPSASYAPAAAVQASGYAPVVGAGGTISFNFADTDIRTVTDQILGGILHVNYTIDPGVSGTATLRTVVPLTRDAGR